MSYEDARFKGQFTIHATSDLAGLLVTPTNGCYISLVVEEATVKEGLDVWIARFDVNLLQSKRYIETVYWYIVCNYAHLATRSRVLQVLEPIAIANKR